MWPLVDKATSGRSVRLSMPLAISPASGGIPNLGAHVRDVYTSHFKHELAAGTIRPLVIPYSLLGAFLLTLLYFSIPHVNRPWLYRARYLLMLFILAFNASEVAGSSSANFATAYAVGLLQAWGILWNATLLLWMSPQFEAERVEKRRRTRVHHEPVLNGTASRAHAKNRHTMENGRPLQNGHAHGLKMVDGSLETPNGHVITAEESRWTTEAPDEDVARSLGKGYEYFWQAYPADASFLTRLDWSFDLVMSFRGTGWNWSVPVIPRFSKPEKPLCGSPVDLKSIPLSTRQGYRRFTTRRSFLRSKILPFILGYLFLDLGSVLMMKDPYFILGPEFATAVTQQSPLPMPSLLAKFPPWLLFTYHSLLGFGEILIAINLLMSLWQVVCVLLLRGMLGTRSELWHYPVVNGGFVANVLDKGMAGFWGGWWHQTFRVAFSAPSAWLAKHGCLDPRSARGKAVAGLIAFALSAFLHSLGSISCLPPSKPWMPPVFFLLSWVGALLQTALCQVAKPATTRLPRWLRRAANLALACVWLHATQFFFCDDLARAGVWLLEPVPVSLLRALGLGQPGDSWFRWGPALWPRLYAGRHWWESGIAL